VNVAARCATRETITLYLRAFAVDDECCIVPLNADKTRRGLRGFGCLGYYRRLRNGCILCRYRRFCMGRRPRYCRCLGVRCLCRLCNGGCLGHSC
jgi:hypothetical protein